MMLFLSQATMILLLTLLFGWLATKIGQARVVGEMVAGIVLGPSVFGRFFPHSFAIVFPLGSLGPFEVLSAIGLILFLFTVGTEIDFAQMQHRGTTALIVSSASILLPFSGAMILAPALRARYPAAAVDNTSFVLFVGIAMSITAFPVLARILEERDLLGSAVGAISIVCAAVDDVVAWLLLALAMTLHASTSFTGFVVRLGMLASYLLVMLAIVRPLASRFFRARSTVGISYEVWGCILAIVFASAAITEGIGVHPLFGAFLAGGCLPQSRQLQASIRAGLNTITSTFLLPIFFVLTGLRTRVDLLNNATVFFWAAVVLAVAVLGKMGGSTLAARWMGQPWREALSLGTLLNTRGLVELVVLNIALDAGIFSPTLFTIFVTMALITTAATSPILNVLTIRSEALRKKNAPIPIPTNDACAGPRWARTGSSDSN